MCYFDFFLFLKGVFVPKDSERMAFIKINIILLFNFVSLILNLAIYERFVGRWNG